MVRLSKNVEWAYLSKATIVDVCPRCGGNKAPGVSSHGVCYLTWCTVLSGGVCTRKPAGGDSEARLCSIIVEMVELYFGCGMRGGGRSFSREFPGNIILAKSRWDARTRDF